MQKACLLTRRLRLALSLARRIWRTEMPKPILRADIDADCSDGHDQREKQTLLYQALPTMSDRLLLPTVTS